MAPTIIYIHFKLDMPTREYEQAIAPLAQPIADVAGLQWKIWLLNESTDEAGGISLFEDQDSAAAFVSGPLIAQIHSAPSISNLRAAQFKVISTLSAITRGPMKRHIYVMSEGYGE
jgi:hypothetical protein